MSCILMPENLRSQNSTVLVHLCRVHKIKHTANRIFAACFIEAHGKGNGQPNGVTGHHLCRVSQVRHMAKMHGLLCARPLPWAVSPGSRQIFPLLCATTLPCACSRSTRQTLPLPCARCFAHGKYFGTRQTHGFR